MQNAKNVGAKNREEASLNRFAKKFRIYRCSTIMFFLFSFHFNLLLILIQNRIFKIFLFFNKGADTACPTMC